MSVNQYIYIYDYISILISTNTIDTDVADLLINIIVVIHTDLLIHYFPFSHISDTLTAIIRILSHIFPLSY